MLLSNCSLLSLDVAIRHSQRLWIKSLGKSPLTGSQSGSTSTFKLQSVQLRYGLYFVAVLSTSHRCNFDRIHWCDFDRIYTNHNYINSNICINLAPLHATWLVHPCTRHGRTSARLTTRHVNCKLLPFTGFLCASFVAAPCTICDRCKLQPYGWGENSMCTPRGCNFSPCNSSERGLTSSFTQLIWVWLEFMGVCSLSDLASPYSPKIHPYLHRYNSVMVHPYSHPQHMMVIKHLSYIIIWMWDGVSRGLQPHQSWPPQEIHAQAGKTRQSTRLSFVLTVYYVC